MKKNTFKNNISIILACALFCFTAVSCDSFMNAGSVRKEIEEAIEYNNALSSTLIFRVQDNSGEFLTGTQKPCKLDYTIDVQFSLAAEEFVYFGLEAKSLDGKQDRSSYVEFSDIGTPVEKSNGIYKTRIKLLKLSDDISIQPVCSAIPKVLSITPKNDSIGCPQDSVIEITFNKELLVESLGNFEWISVSMDDVPLIGNYFKVPYLKTPTTICIEPLSIEDESKLLLAPNGSVENKIITVSVRVTGEQKDKTEIPLTRNTDYKYTINKTYGNYKATTVSFSSITADGKTNTGAFLSSAQKNCVIGYSAEIEFQVNKTDYYFNGFEAVSNSDKTTSLESLVSFSQIINQSDTEKGIYHYRVTVEALPEIANDILIRPKCLLLPAVISVSPLYNEDGSNTSTPVDIAFNMPMEAAGQQGNSLFTFKNISIIYTDSSMNEIDMSTYFEAPVFDSKKQMLTLKPKPVSLSSYISDFLLKEYLDVKIILGEKLSVQKDGITLPLKQNENTSFTVRFKPVIERTPPERKILAAAKTNVAVSSAAAVPEISHDELIAAGQFDDSHFADDETILAHRVGDYVYFYGRYYDAESGVRTCVISEKLVNDKKGELIRPEQSFVDYTYDLVTDENVQSVYDENGYVVFRVAHKINCEDGLVQLKLLVKDNGGNSSEERIITVIHDTTFGMKDVLPYNVDHNEYRSWGLGFSYFDKTNYDTEIKTLRLFSERKSLEYDPNAVISKLIYKNFYLDIHQISIDCVYQDTPRPFVYNEGTKEWTYTLTDVEDVTGFKFDITLQDDMGNTLTKSYQIPGKSFVINTDNTYTYLGSDYPFGNIVVIKEDEQGNYYGYNSERMSQSEEGYAVLRTGNLFGPMNETKILPNNQMAQDDSLPPVQIESVDFEKLEKNYYRMTVNINESAWDTYSTIAIRHYNPGYASPYYSIFEQGSTQFTFTEHTSQLWNYATQIDVWGVKGGARSAIAQTTCPDKPLKDMEDSYTYDNMPPNITSVDNYMNIVYAAYYNMYDPTQIFDYIAFCDAFDVPGYIDNENVTWTIDDGNKVYTGARYERYISYRKNNVSDHDDTSFSGYFIPVWDMDKDKVKVRLTVKDGNNNTSSFTKQVNFVNTPYFEIDLGSYDWGNSKTNLIAKKVPGCNPIMFWRVAVYKLVSENYAYNARWILCEDASKNMGQIDFSAHPDESENSYTFTDVQLPKNSFIKIVTTACWRGTTATEEYGISDSYYAYTLSEDEDSYSNFETDFLLTGEEGVIVGSNKPVFVQTYITKRPYEECKNWTIADWEHRHKHVYTQLIPFSNNDKTPKFYEYPQYEIDEGDCFVVIARYATDEIPERISKVHVKE